MVENSGYIRSIVVKISKNDDQEAFRKLFDLFYPRMIRFADYYLESGIVSDEIVSTIFMNLWNRRKSLTEIERLEGYLFNAVKFKCLNYLRDTKKLHFEDINREEFKLLPSLENPEGEFLTDELRHLILKSIEKLPPRCKIIFELVRDSGLKYKEVSALLDISVKTVEVQMGRALNKIRQDILPYLSEKNHIYKLRETKSAVNFLSLFL